MQGIVGHKISMNGGLQDWSVTREEVGLADIPGQGWLQVGPNGPIPKAGR